jgi:hypothetical protein
LYKKSKLNVSEVQSSFVTRPVHDELTWDQIKQCIDTRKTLGTLLRCQHGTATGALGMVEKQFCSVAVPHWCGTGAVGSITGLTPIQLTESQMALTDAAVRPAISDALDSSFVAIPQQFHVGSEVSEVDFMLS